MWGIPCTSSRLQGQARLFFKSSLLSALKDLRQPEPETGRSLFEQLLFMWGSGEAMKCSAVAIHLWLRTTSDHQSVFRGRDTTLRLGSRTVLQSLRLDFEAREH